MAAVQFYGKDAVVKAYSGRGIDCWAVFASRNLLQTGDSAGELGDYLDQLAAGGTAAEYTLNFYRDVEDHNDIMPKTECAGSFRFKLNEGSMSGVGSPVRYAGTGSVVQNQVAAYVEGEIGKIIKEKLEGADKPEKKETLSDVLMGLLQQPEQLIGVINAARAWFSPGAAVGMPVTLAGTRPVLRAGAATPAPEPDEPVISEAEAERLGEILDRLGRVDPKIVDHLGKLADLAEKKPDMYKMALTMLK